VELQEQPLVPQVVALLEDVAVAEHLLSDIRAETEGLAVVVGVVLRPEELGVMEVSVAVVARVLR
jgi:hypothetical protein